jgi:pimeloyl-ACP methyl ester carboxylesterase
LIALALCSCASPASRVDAITRDSGFERKIIEGASFRHVVYRKPGEPTRRLHVYIEHDGRPWRNETTVSADPTPSNPLMLRLAALDSAPTLYLGRPCYWGLASTPPCSPLLWTHERYSERVVDSMAAALRQLISADSEILLFGHSGGGALAVLLAERFPETRAVVTIAGNLDHAAWTEHHRYTPLAGSLNPISRSPLDADVIQKHYIGGRDIDVPSSIARAFVLQHPAAQVIEYREFDHRCCWERVWPEILDELNRDFARAGASSALHNFTQPRNAGNERPLKFTGRLSPINFRQETRK